MASDVSRTVLRGLGVPDARLNLSSLQDRGTGATDSKYAEAGPVAGVPEANQSTGMVLEATGTPSNEGHILITTQRAGSPGLEGAGYYWSDQAEAAPVDLGWDAPSLVTGWDSLLYTELTSFYAGRVTAIRLQSGDLLAFGVQASAGSKGLTPHYYTVSTAAWSDLSTLTLDDPTEQKGVGLLQLPSGRVLLFVQTTSDDQVDVYFSDNDGTSWAIYARRVLDTPPATADIQTISVAYSNQGVLMVLTWLDGSSNRTASAYGSSSLGTAFTQTLENWRTSTAEEPEAVNVVPLLSGGFVVGYADQKAPPAAYRTRRIASAMLSPVAETGAVIAAVGPLGGTFASLALWRGEDGLLYALVYLSALHQVGVLRRSEDEGLTWAAFSPYTRGLNVHPASPSARLEGWSAVETHGKVALITRWTAPAADEDVRSIGCLWLGGYSTHTAPAEDGGLNYRDTDQIIFNQNVTAGPGGIWYPIETPDNVNWSADGAAVADLVAPGELEITGSANPLIYTRTVTGSLDKLFVEIAVEIDFGDGALGANNIGIRLRLADAAQTYEYDVSVRLASSGISLYDENNATTIGADATGLDLTSRVHIRVALDKGEIRTWYSQQSGATPAHAHHRTWTLGPTGAVTTTPGVATNLIQFGHEASSSDVSRWAMVGYCFWPGTWGPATADLVASWSTPDDLHPRSFSAVPHLIHDGTAIAARSGPAKIGDSWDTKQDADYPVANIFPDVNPSPLAHMRTTADETEVLIALDLSGLATGAGMSTSWFFALLGINFRQAVVEAYNGSSWTTVLTLDARHDFDALQMQRYGDVVVPLKGGAAHQAGRYIWAGELVGGTLVDTGKGLYREIVENTSGAWTDETAAIPHIRFAKGNDAESTSGPCELWTPNIIGIRHEVTDFRRYWRLRIPSQNTAQGDYRIGQLVIGRVHAFGVQHGHGYSTTVTPQVSVSRGPSGSSRARKLGKALRSWEIGWSEPIDASRALDADPVPDYISGSTSGIPIASPADTLRSLAGQLGQMDGASSPVMFLPHVPRGTGDHLISDPNLWLYGRIESPARRQNVLGDEGVSEFDRGDSIVIEEIG